MSLLHPKSSESVHSGLDLFAVPPSQTAINDGAFVEFYPLSTITPGAPIDFSISGATEDYLDLHNTYLHVKAKIVKGDGAILGIGEDVAPSNYFLHTLFSQVDIALNDTLISASENTYPYRAYLEATLGYSPSAKKGHLTASLFYRDSTNHFEDTQGDGNTGLKARRQAAARSREIDMMGRLHTDLMHQERYMLPGVDVKIKLIPSKSAFNLIAHDRAVGYKTIITHASLFVRKAKVNPAVSLAHEKALEKATAKYPMKRVLLKTFSIPRGQLSHVQDNLFLSQTPTRIVIGLVDTASFNGEYTRNPFNFKTHRLNFLSLYLDGKQIPSKPLTPDYPSRQYVRAFYGLMTAVGLTSEDAGNYIEYRYML